MFAWQQLEQQFNELSAPHGNVRLNIQWGAAGDLLQITGYFDATTKQRFVTLAGKSMDLSPTNKLRKSAITHTASNVNAMEPVVYGAARSKPAESDGDPMK